MGTWSTSWNKQEVTGSILGFDEVGDAPQVPGIYSWYSSLGLGDLDLKDENQTRRALRKQTTKYKPSSLTGEVKGNLGAVWKGELFDQSMDKLSLVLSELASNDEIDENHHNSQISRVLSDESMRKIMITHLEHCIPVFLSPLYVGISANLKKRLLSHVSLFRKLKRQKRIGSSFDFAEDEISDSIEKDFASRAISKGFNEDNLFVFILPFQDLETLTKQQIKDVVCGVEFLVNRWSKPSLGER